LGLAIVRRIVESAGGALELADASGGGLDVRMAFPILAA
jgi:nitrogen fixation/metabolism regulation signal transduction histidine kinase